MFGTLEHILLKKNYLFIYAYTSLYAYHKEDEWLSMTDLIRISVMNCLESNKPTKKSECMATHFYRQVTFC